MLSLPGQNLFYVLKKLKITCPSTYLKLKLEKMLTRNFESKNVEAYVYILSFVSVNSLSRVTSVNLSWVSSRDNLSLLMSCTCGHTMHISLLCQHILCFSRILFPVTESRTIIFEIWLLFFYNQE